MAVTGLIGVVASACGSGTSSSSGGGSAATSTTIIATTTSVAAPIDTDTGADTTSSTALVVTTSTVQKSAQALADEAVARKALLTLADLPEGWTATPSDNTSSSDDEEANRQFTECVGGNLAVMSNDGSEVQGPDFASPNGDSVYNSIAFAGSPDALEADLAVLRSPKMLPCMKEMFVKEIEAGINDDLTMADTPPVTIGTPELDEFALPEIADAVRGFRMSVPITGPGGTITMYVDLVFAAKGRAEITLGAMGLGAALPTEMTVALLQKVVDRLPASF